MEKNQCTDCGERLASSDRTDAKACCCGSVDVDGNYYDAYCGDCCADYHGVHASSLGEYRPKNRIPYWWYA